MRLQRVRHEWATFTFTLVSEKAFKLHFWEIFLTGIDTWDRKFFFFFFSFRILTVPLIIFSLTWFLMGGSSNFHHCSSVHGGSFLPLLPSTFPYLFQQFECDISVCGIYVCTLLWVLLTSRLSILVSFITFGNYSHYIFKYLFCLVLCLFSFWVSSYKYVDDLTLPHSSLMLRF